MKTVPVYENCPLFYDTIRANDDRTCDGEDCSLRMDNCSWSIEYGQLWARRKPADGRTCTYRDVTLQFHVLADHSLRVYRKLVMTVFKVASVGMDKRAVECPRHWCHAFAASVAKKIRQRMGLSVD